MKKIVVLFIFALSLGGLGQAQTSQVSAATDGQTSPSQVEVNVNGELVQMDVRPVITKQSVMIPIRSLSSLGLTYTWEASSQSAMIHNKTGDVLKITGNSRTAYINGEAITMTVPAQTHKGRVLVPIRFITESLGYQVRYDATSKIVYISSSKDQEESLPINLDDYVSLEQRVQKKEEGSKITWTVGNIAVHMERSEAVGEEAAESKYVFDSFTLENKDKVHPVKLAKKPSSVSSISLSPSGEYLALDVFYNNVGHQVIIIDVETGEQRILNKDKHLSSSNDGVETIHAYNWAPNGNALAFAYGDTSSSHIGIYDFDKQSFLNLSSEGQGYITTAFVLWNKNGDSLDVISEQPSDQYKLYRYNLQEGSVNVVAPLQRAELVQFSKFRP